MEHKLNVDFHSSIFEMLLFFALDFSYEHRLEKQVWNTNHFYIFYDRFRAVANDASEGGGGRYMCEYGQRGVLSAKPRSGRVKQWVSGGG